MDAVEIDLRLRCRLLARDIVRFDRFTRRAIRRGRLDQVAELEQRRELACDQRSRLLRELWRR
jgi:hypothetical protein